MAEYDPTKIDVSLSLLSGADSAAAKDLGKQLETVAGHFDSIHKSFESYGDKLDKIAEKLSKMTNTEAEKGGASSPAKAQAHRDGQPPPGTTPEDARSALGGTTGATTGTGGRRSSYATPGGSSTPQGTRTPTQTQERDQGMGPPLSAAARSNLGLMGTGMSGRWISNAYNKAYNRVTPGGAGETALGRAADVFGKGTGGFFDHDAQARLRGGQSSLLEESMNDPFRAYIAIQAAQRGARAAAGIFRDPAGLDTYSRQAQTLGYERGGQIQLPGGVGFTLPGLQYFQGGTAGGEARHMKGAEIWARSHAGVNKREAQDIIGETSAAGFSGSMADGSVRLMTDMYSRHRMDPGLVKNFFGQLRTGSSNFKDVNNQLESLAIAAKGAGLNINQMAEQVAAAGEFNQSIGGTFASGAGKATAFTNATGLPADRYAKLMQNPLVSGMISAQTGLPPQMQGLLGTSGSLSGMDQAYKLAKGMSRGIGGSMASSHAIIDPATGKPMIGQDGKPVVERTSARDVEDSFAASQLGMNIEEYRKYGHNMKRHQAAGSLEAIIQKDALAKQTGWGGIEHLGRQAGIKKSELDKIGKEGTYKERREGIEKALADINKGDMGKKAGGVEIRLTKKAEHFFELMADEPGKLFKGAKKVLVQAGKGTLAEAANSVEGLVGLGGSHNTFWQGP